MIPVSPFVRAKESVPPNKRLWLPDTAAPLFVAAMNNHMELEVLVIVEIGVVARNCHLESDILISVE